MDSSKTSANSNEPVNHDTPKGKTEVTIPLDTRQGGKTVEFISREDMQTTNDPNACSHTFVPDPSETEFDAYTCVKPHCGLVILRKKEM